MKVNKYIGFMFPALLTAVLAVLTPRVSVAGLADKVKAEAAKVNAGEEAKKLSNTVLKEIDKKIADVVGNKPISETDKADITKKLSGIARPIVKKLIDGAGSGKLPESAELVNTVMSEILPQADELADAIIEAERERSAATMPPSSPQPEPEPESIIEPSPEPLFEPPPQQPLFQPYAQPLFESPPSPQVQSAEPAQPLFQPLPPPPPTRPSAPRVGKQSIAAVYVTGGSDVGDEIKESVGTGILNAIVNDKKHISIESGKEFLAEVDALRSAQTDNTVYDSQISEIGAKFGVDFVCAAEITTTSEAFHVLSRMIDVQTAEVVSVGNVFSPLKSEDDIAIVSGELVKKMAVGGGEPPSLVIQKDTTIIVRDTTIIVRDTISSREYEDTRASKTGFLFGYGLSMDADSKADFLQLGFVHSRPIFKEFMSVNVEGNFWLGIGEYRYKYYDGSGYDYAHNSFDFFGANVPVTISVKWSVFSIEAGLFGDALFVDSEIFYNVGFIAGTGVSFDKKRARWFFYKYNIGYNYVTHVVGMRWLF